MLTIEIILAVLLIWWLCAVFNIATFQWINNDNFNNSNRTTTMFLSFLIGPFTTVIILVVSAGYFPLKLGTRWGRMLGRKLEDLFD